MSKKNKEEVMEKNELDFYKSFSKDVGGDLLDDLSNCPGFIDTGILSVNYICSGLFYGGGLPIGSMAEVSGESASGKSVFGTNILRGCQSYNSGAGNGIAVLHDAEHAISKDFAIKASRVDPKKLIVTEADTLQRSFNKINKIIRQARGEAKIPLERPICIIYDSIAASPSDREFAETTVDMETTTKAALKEAGGGTPQPGERARTCSAELRKLMPIVKEHHALVVFVNQVRTNIGQMFGDTDCSAGGGRALKFYVSTILKMYSYKKIKDERDVIIGTNVTFKNAKSRYTAPFQEAKNVRLFFDRGIDPFGGLLELMIQLGRIENTSGGNYKVNNPWADGKEIKFRTTKESNTIPYETLLECPALVDATTSDQIEYYIKMFGSAVAAVNQKGLKEEAISSGEVM